MRGVGSTAYRARAVSATACPQAPAGRATCGAQLLAVRTGSPVRDCGREVHIAADATDARTEKPCVAKQCGAPPHRNRVCGPPPGRGSVRNDGGP